MIRIEGDSDVEVSAGILPVVLGVVLGFFLGRKVIR